MTPTSSSTGGSHTGQTFRITTWTVLVPGIAAAICGVWTTAAYGALPVVTYVLVDSARPDQYQAGFGDFLLVALGGSAGPGAPRALGA
ncbi:hypothetical protein ABZV75_14685 [Streptomyces flaveolus]|uniref:hypothetical protein n=1 Tax=Streptomyces flaveolus TaxID=67297 RepID=UPI0033B4AAED